MALGVGNHVYVIAEIGINHNGDEALAGQLIDAAAEAGCDAVKLQKRTIERVYSAEELARQRTSPFGKTSGDLKHGLEFDLDAYGRLAARAKRSGIDLFASVWDEVSVAEMAGIEMPFLKIPSPLIRHFGLLEHAKDTGIPVIISTGGATEVEVDAALQALGDATAAVMHCVSAYPNVPESVNLRQMLTLRDRYQLPVGYSSHELGPHAVWAAVAMGATFIERHVTLDRTMWGSDQSMSTEMGQLADLVDGIRTVQQCLGSPEITCLDVEKPAIHKLARSVDYLTDEPG